jgi:hypothetical protein
MKPPKRVLVTPGSSPSAGAAPESFFAALKNELVYRNVWPMKNKARQAIAEYLEVLKCSTIGDGLHSGLGCKTPWEVTEAYRQNRSHAA